MAIKGQIKKLLCNSCDKEFEAYPTINGKKHNGYGRKYCYICSPVGRKNRARLSKIGKPIPDGHKYCPSCKNVLSLSHFGNAKVPYCRKCNNKKSKDDRLTHKKKIVGELGGCCSICGFDKYLSALDFHHIDPSTKTSNLAHMRKSSISWIKVKAELDKCVLLCANCHRAIHSGELSFDS